MGGIELTYSVALVRRDGASSAFLDRSVARTPKRLDVHQRVAEGRDRSAELLTCIARGHFDLQPHDQQHSQTQ